MNKLPIYILLQVAKFGDSKVVRIMTFGIPKLGRASLILREEFRNLRIGLTVRHVQRNGGGVQSLV
jgi:hypothetical protein